MIDGVYDRIKARVLARAIAPGQLLQIGVLSQELGVSSTPVREALMRLAAERLIVLVPKKGFFTKILSEEELRGLYCVTSSILESALHLHAPADDASSAAEHVQALKASGAADRPQLLVRRTAELFIRIAARSDICEYVDIVRNANDRLYQARLIEFELLEGAPAEFSDLENLYVDARTDALVAALREYHARRIEWIPTICKELLFRPFASMQR